MREQLTPILKTSEVITKHPVPVLDGKQIPYDADCIFNAGVVKYNGQYVMVFRNDYEYVDGKGFNGCNLGIAFSENGIDWNVREKPFLTVEDMNNPEVTRVYDPRLTVVDGELLMCFAVDTKHGVCGGIARIHDLEKLEILSVSTPDNRNMVLFPEKVNGKYIRLERPFPVYSRGGVDRFDIWISESPDLVYWGNSKLLLAVEDVPFANDKIGPAAPPIKTDRGWLTLFHAVDIDQSRGKNGWEATWKKRYTAGVMLLDSGDPSHIIGLYREPLMAPDTEYEIDGFRGNVIFPGGLVAEEDGKAKIYYGAADTVECLATAHIDDLIELCLKG